MDVFGGGLEVHPAGEVETEESLAVDTHLSTLLKPVKSWVV